MERSSELVEQEVSSIKGEASSPIGDEQSDLEDVHHESSATTPLSPTSLCPSIFSFSVLYPCFVPVVESSDDGISLVDLQRKSRKEIRKFNKC